MSDEQALIPIEERQVDFYSDDIIAVLVDVNGEEHVYIPVRPICTNLGGNPNILCLPLDFLNGWLFGINAARVKEEHREKVVGDIQRRLGAVERKVKPTEIISDEQASDIALCQSPWRTADEPGRSKRQRGEDPKLLPEYIY